MATQLGKILSYIWSLDSLCRGLSCGVKVFEDVVIRLLRLLRSLNDIILFSEGVGLLKFTLVKHIGLTDGLALGLLASISAMLKL